MYIERLINDQAKLINHQQQTITKGRKSPAKEINMNREDITKIF